MPSLEANIPTMSPSKPYNAQPPFFATPATGVAQTIYDRATETKHMLIALQNLGTTPVKVAYNQAVTDANYHFSLAAGGASGDGSGGKVEIDCLALGIVSISVITTGATMNLSIRKFTR